MTRPARTTRADDTPHRGLPTRLLDAEGSDTATIEMLGTFGSLGAFDRLSRSPTSACCFPGSTA